MEDLLRAYLEKSERIWFDRYRSSNPTASAAAATEKAPPFAPNDTAKVSRAASDDSDTKIRQTALDGSDPKIQKTVHDDSDTTPKNLPKGVVLGADGKPCRSCTSFASWAAMNKSRSSKPSSPPPATSTTTTAATSSGPPAHCPPDVEVLGRSTWTLLHSLPLNLPSSSSSSSSSSPPSSSSPSATSSTTAAPDATPARAAPSTTPTQQLKSDTATFLRLFSRLYPCSPCAQDFNAWMQQPGNEVEKALSYAGKGGPREGLGRWMCEAHNEVNRKLGKEVFDCGKWEERWGTGAEDGSCD